MKRLLIIIPALALLGGVQAMAADAPADPVVETAIPPIAPPIDDVPYIIHDVGTFEFAPPTTSDGVQPIYHDAGAFTTTPQHDQCWNPGPAGVVMESGTFVIYGNDDPRRWGTHSIGGMNCGPADLPLPEPAPTQAAALAAVPQYDATGEACD